MNLQKDICSAFCDGLNVRKIPMGFSISTPATWFSGDRISFYARIDGERARLEDSGSLMFDLEGQGVDFSSENRRQILSSLLSDHGITFSDDEGMFTTGWVKKEELAKLALPFLTFLQRVRLLAQHRLWTHPTIE